MEIRKEAMWEALGLEVCKASMGDRIAAQDHSRVKVVDRDL